MYRCMLDLGVWPAQTVVKVDDTAPGIAEGIAAGCWTVGVVASGNALGLDLAEYLALSDPERVAALAAARIGLDAAGAHELVDSVASLPAALDRIRERIGSGERP
jgi:phosphonoacetaldehyde hydrolase